MANVAGAPAYAVPLQFASPSVPLGKSDHAHGLREVLDAELGQDLLAMQLDCAYGNSKVAGRFAGRFAGNGALEHFELSRCKSLETGAHGCKALLGNVVQ